MHCNMSLFRGGTNAFYDAAGKNGLSKEAYHFIGGLMRHAKGMTAITNPLINSYKRLVPGYEAPVYIAWSFANRSPLIRIPVARGEGTRLELRHPDPSCNPYLAITTMLAAGLDGIRNEIEPPPAVGQNIYHMTDDDLTRAGIERLPRDLNDAVEELLRDEIITTALGKHVVHNYVKAKQIEWKEYTERVHAWERDKYLVLY